MRESTPELFVVYEEYSISKAQCHHTHMRRRRRGRLLSVCVVCVHLEEEEEEEKGDDRVGRQECKVVIL